MGDEVQVSWRDVPILLGVGVSLIASSLAVAKTEQYRLTYVTHVTLWPPLLDALGMILIGSGSVWCGNVIISTGLTLGSHNTSYDIGFMIISAAVCIAFTLFGFTIAIYDRIFTKTKLEILHMFISDSVTHNIESVRNTSAVMRLGLLKGIVHIILGGVLMGIGVFACHLLLVLGLRADDVKVQFDVGVLVAAAMVSIIGCILSCWMIFRVLSFYPHKEILRVIATLLLCSTHVCCYFIVISSCTFRTTSSSQASISRHIVDLSSLRDGVLCASMIFLWCMAYTYHIDMRHRHYTADRVLRKTDDIMSMLQHDPRLTSDPNILRYHNLRRKSTRRSTCCGMIDISEASHVPSILLSRSRSSTKVFVENVPPSAEGELSACVDVEDDLVMAELQV